MSEKKQVVAAVTISNTFTGDLKKNVKICDYFVPNIKYEHLRSDEIKYFERRNVNQKCIIEHGLFTVQEKINGTHGVIVQISNGDIYFCSRNLVLINTENMGFKKFCTSSKIFDRIKAFFIQFPFHMVYGEFDYDTNGELLKFHVFDVAKVVYTNEMQQNLKLEFLFLPSIYHQVVEFFPDTLKCTEYKTSDDYNYIKIKELLLYQLVTMEKCEGYVVKLWNHQRKFVKSVKILNPNYKHFNAIHNMRKEETRNVCKFELDENLFEKCCRKYYEDYYNEKSKNADVIVKDGVDADIGCLIDGVDALDYYNFLKSIVDKRSKHSVNKHTNILVNYLIVELEEESHDEKCISLAEKLINPKTMKNVRKLFVEHFINYMKTYSK